MPIITGPAAFDPMLGKMRTKDVSGGTASGDYTFNNTEFTVGAAGLVSLNQVHASKLDTVSDIVNVTGSSVTLQPNTAYKMYATTGALNVTANPPAANKWAYEGHAEIFVGSVGYVVFDTSTIVLANQLEPNAVNNCTLRFHDGMCYVSVEDHIAGYIVVSATGTTAGSLPYGISSASQEYIAFDASLNGTTIDLSGSTANGEKHIVGNSYNDTILTGDVNCGTSKFTVANLSLNNVVVSSGTLTLGDAFIPSGSTVAVSGGGLAVERVTGAGSESVINLGGTQFNLAINATMTASGVAFTGGATGGSPILLGSSTTATFSGCVFSGLFSPDRGTIRTLNGAITSLVGCLVEDNSSPSFGNCALVTSSSVLIINGSTIGEGQDIQLGPASVVFSSENHMLAPLTRHFSDSGNFGTVTLTSGAVLDLTGNTNATPIAPGGGVTFDPGGATVLYSSGAVSGSYSIDNVTLPSGAKLTNTNVVDLGGKNIVVPYIDVGIYSYASGCVFTGGSNTTNEGGGAVLIGYGRSAFFDNCVFSGNSSLYGAAIRQRYNGSFASFSGCTFSGNVGASGTLTADYSATTILNDCTFATGETIILSNAAKVELVNSNTIVDISGTSGTVTISSGASINLTSSIAPGGTGGIQVVGGTCTINSVIVNATPEGSSYSFIVNSNGTLYIDGEPAE